MRHVYLSLIPGFLSDSVGYPGMCKYLKNASDEEREHVFKLCNIKIFAVVVKYVC